MAYRDSAPDIDTQLIMRLLLALSDYVLELPDGLFVSGRDVRAAMKAVAERLADRG